MGKNPRGAFVLCIELGKIRDVVKSLLLDIVGQNKRLASRGERAVIRDNISQNWWIYYPVTKLTANVNHISSLEAWTSLLQMSEWFIFLFLSPRAVTTGPPPASWGQQLWSSVLGQARMSQERWELTASRLLRVTATAELKMAWRCPEPRVCSRLTVSQDNTRLCSDAAYMRWADTDQGGHRGLRLHITRTEYIQMRPFKL